MSTRDDNYVDDDYEAGGAVRGSGGAILGVLMTLVIGGGLVFAAYKLGQRTSVDEPPLLTAEAGEAKMAPIDAGGQPIANQDNDAYTMIDEIRRTGTGSNATGAGAGTSAGLTGNIGGAVGVTPIGQQDGIIVTDRLPDRALNSTGTLGITGVQEDALRIDELQLASSIDGEPSLTGNAAPNRTGDLELAGGAEVQVADSDAVLRAETAAADAAQRAAAERDVASLGLTDPARPSAVAPPPAVLPLTRSTDTQVAATATAPAPNALTEQDFGEGLVLFPVPRSKPPLSRRPETAARAAAANPSLSGRQQPSVSAATTRVPAVVPIPAPAPVPGQVIAPPGLQAQPLAIPPQPAGDAQVQLGAMPTPDQVRVRWGQLRAQYPGLLGQLGLQVQPVRTAQGQSLFRLRAGPLRDSRSAAQLCDQLRVRGVDCFVPTR